jgi:hypothetical protein
MDAHLPDDLKALQERLSGWLPAQAALDADRMLFAAGRASVRPSKTRFLWPAATACLAVVTVVLGIGLVHERAERLDLARRLARPAEQVPIKDSVQPSSDPGDIPPSGPLSPASYLAGRAALERGDADAWQMPAAQDSPAPAPPGTPIPRAWSPGTLLEN